MVTYYPELARRVRSQRDLQPDLYGDFDFDRQPDRLATEPDVDSALPTWVADRAPILEDDRVVELISTATMLGDVVADPYAALMNTHSVTQLIDMLKTACREGIEAVPDAPPELASFIAAMEATPEWIDFDLVREGARQERIPAALLAPFITRGAFIATFTNTYAALPMALTGALSGKRAARRVNETASFFAVTTLPGALDRYGPGFEAAAMVRLMHSMVRYNALKKSDKWDDGRLRHAGAAGRPDARRNDRPVPVGPQSAPAGPDGVHRRRTRRRRIRQVSLLSARPAGGAAARGTRRHHPRPACALGTAAPRIRRHLPRTRPGHDGGLPAPRHDTVRPVRRGGREEFQQAHVRPHVLRW